MIQFISSKIPSKFESTDYKIVMWAEAGLPKPSIIRYKIATIDPSIAVKALGSLQYKDRLGISERLCSLLCFKP